jgi:hypothetical protein
MPERAMLLRQIYIHDAKIVFQAGNRCVWEKALELAERDIIHIVSNLPAIYKINPKDKYISEDGIHKDFFFNL